VNDPERTHPSRILVVFSSIRGETERRALAAGVGAVEARAVIRLRRLMDPDDGPVGTDALERMRREYVPPTPDDLEWADGVVFCPSKGSPAVWTSCLDLIGRMSGEGRLDGKVAVVAGEMGHPLGVSASLLGCGFIVLPPLVRASFHGADAEPGIDPHADARMQGRRLAMVTRALRGKPITSEQARMLL
jgi:hypothetical protein